MNKNILPKRVLRNTGFAMAVTLALSLLLDSSNGWGGSELFTGIALMLVLGSMLYLKNMENISERDIRRRIQAEYSPESQPQILDIYQHLKAKELEGLFAKILDDANGDLIKVKKLASLAEGIGWQAFLNNHF